MKKNDVLVEGTNWNVKGVLSLDSNEEDFVIRHIDNDGTYTNMTKEKKLSTLKLVWKLCQENNPTPNSTVSKK